MSHYVVIDDKMKFVNHFQRDTDADAITALRNYAAQNLGTYFLCKAFTKIAARIPPTPPDIVETPINGA